MSEEGKKVLEEFEKIIPKLTDAEKGKLLSFAEGMAFMKDEQAKQNTAAG